MPAKKIVHQSVSKSEYKDYLKKAEEFYATMQECFINGRWTSAALEAIHAAISVNDALTIFTRGIKCSSPRHEDAATLLQSLVELDGAKVNSRHLLQIVKKKNIVEYYGETFGQKEAEEITQHAERFFNWVKSILPKE
jgi:HEPN domain-containing protein